MEKQATKQLEFRNLRADEIQVRIGQVYTRSGWASLLLYKDARVDIQLLNETFGVFGWQRRHTRDNANCIVAVWDSENKHWVEKEDTGTESQFESEKGLASSSFKRACTNLGIGLSLYTAPQILLKAGEGYILDTNGGVSSKNRFKVKEIEYDGNNHISKLVIENLALKKVVYTFPYNKSLLEKSAEVRKKLANA